MHKPSCWVMFTTAGQFDLFITLSSNMQAFLKQKMPAAISIWKAHAWYYKTFTRVFSPRCVGGRQSPYHTFIEYLCIDIMSYCTVHAVVDIFMILWTQVSNWKYRWHVSVEDAGEFFVRKMREYYYNYSRLFSPQNLIVPDNHCIIEQLNKCASM